MIALGAVTGRPLLFLRAEGLVLMVAGVAAFLATDEPWWLLPALLLVPDICMLAYLRSPRAGALAYNLGHSYALPATLGLAGVLAGSSIVPALALIWLAHIGMDRMLGYGLKYDTAFTDTHLGTIGPRAGTGSG